MCGPLALAGIGLAASAAGSFMQNQQANAVSKARNKAMAAEAARQKAFSADAFKAFDVSKGTLTRPAQDQALAATAAQRESDINRIAASDAGVGEYQPTGEAPQVVQSEIARKMLQAIQKGRETAGQIARLGASGDVQFGNRLALNTSGNQIDMLGNFSQGSANVLPYELNAANQKGQQWGTFGDILGGIGSMAGMASAAGGFQDWFGAPAKLPNLKAIGPGGLIGGGV